MWTSACIAALKSGSGCNIVKALQVVCGPAVLDRLSPIRDAIPAPGGWGPDLTPVLALQLRATISSCRFAGLGKALSLLSLLECS